jgi:hypothetical protein
MVGAIHELPLHAMQFHTDKPVICAV